MERHIELQVRYASASMDGETATIAVATDHGHLTLRMHRIVLGALAGTIARALFPKVGDSVPAQGPIEMQELLLNPGQGSRRETLPTQFPKQKRRTSSSNPGQRRRQRAALRSLVLSRKTSRPNRRETLPTEFPKQSRRRS